MEERRLLVDFENVQKIDFSLIPNDVLVIIFVGNSQKTVPFELVEDAPRLGNRVKWLKVEGNGNNALDFHIAFYLGLYTAKSPKSHYFVLSQDTGFDPLMKHLNKEGICCNRIENLTKLQKPSAPPKATIPTKPKPLMTPSELLPDTRYERVLTNLKKSQKNRPRSRTTLVSHISALFGKKLCTEEVQDLMNRLFKEGRVTEGKISESDTALQYHLT
jgi:hypothetical protein